MLVFLCIIVTRSSPGSGVTAAGGSTSGSHILVVQRQNINCALPYCRSRSYFKEILLISSHTRASSNSKKTLFLCLLCTC
ncbi:uncharacterized protein M421DRAFT_132959 [Didymella exigua CBS 183.55]|uniref:Secreted protein n=1 Tax=Didymella exigua CBS 183.55 TaxID=1150837 RepID=A0A6A5RPA8_9PLEO|nr:uncharacterized protein M421DRAFT_132959 [Didymella exigua CBS 183.55]KAF1929160.1 hypothetical protein M421DRAFT_132959 [Didymella exigua CBS 183.55]